MTPGSAWTCWRADVRVSTPSRTTPWVWRWTSLSAKTPPAPLGPVWLLIYGPVRRDVARIAIHLTSGNVGGDSPLGQDARFAVNFYVAGPPPDIPGRSSAQEVIVYDADGNELDRLEPTTASRPRRGPAPLTVQFPAYRPMPVTSTPMSRPGLTSERSHAGCGGPRTAPLAPPAGRRRSAGAVLIT